VAAIRQTPLLGHRSQAILYRLSIVDLHLLVSRSQNRVDGKVRQPRLPKAARLPLWPISINTAPVLPKVKHDG